MRNEHENDHFDDEVEDTSPTFGSPFRFARKEDPPSPNSKAGLFGHRKPSARYPWPELPAPQEDSASEDRLVPVWTRVNGEFMPLSWQSLANAVYGNAPGLN